MARIVRGPRAADHFTIISNAALRDERLSWKARGLLAYLLSMDTGWETSIRRLATVAPDGKSAVETALAELEALGYLERRQQRAAEAGKFGHTEYHVCDDATVTGSSGHGGDESTVTRLSVDGSTVHGSSATKKTSPKKNPTTEDSNSSAALRAATADTVETSSSSSSSGNAIAIAAAAATGSADHDHGDAPRAVQAPSAILEAMMLNTDEATRFRTWLVTATNAKNPDGLIVTLHTSGRLSERISQWRTSETFTRTVPGSPSAARGHLAWCGDCDRQTRTAVATDAEGREYVRRCPACNINASPVPVADEPAPPATDDITGDAYEAARAARAALPTGVRRRRTTIGTVTDIATVRAAQMSDQ